ncbi:hypothetical protein B9479_002499 [Cryptococcus floricola]|uniref:RPA43 OB domain-containing protein n=1 Tax=Cryptococcus floricola TaxID=2591691 RepID=A0A5D3B2E3_9TREE|nr:hypothetical protein B9479_002499 [Cryptococcus floricola]
MSHPNATASSSKHKKDKSHKKDKHRDSKDKKDKKHKHKEVKKEGKHDKSPFEHRISRMRISVPPKFAGDVMMGVREQLDGMVMRYVPQMGGVLLAHWEHSFEDETAKIVGECPFGVVEVEFHSVLWAPKIGQKLFGAHSLSSPSHLSLLFSKTFNVSIPLQHIPAELYEFEHTDETAPEEDSDSEDEVEYLGGLGNLASAVEEVGRWREKANGKALGNDIKFTVIGMQVTNQMLSLTGSLLSDPFNPPALPEPVAAPAHSPSPSPSPEPQARPQKKARVINNAPELKEEEVDTTGMTARELKAHRKEQEKKKRDARKARKGDEQGEEDEQTAGTKRKADEDNAEGRKKKKGGE